MAGRDQQTGPRRKNRFWRICRIYLRRVRITVWLLILALVGGLVYLNQVGLPGFIKNRLLNELRVHGVELRFSRLRLSFYYGILAENVQFGQTGQPLMPQMSASEVAVQLNAKALARLRLQVDSVTLRKGRLTWPVPAQGGPPREIPVEDIQTDLRFLPNDQWALDHFRARFAGAQIQVSGTLTNASAVRQWQLWSTGKPAPPGQLERRLTRLADTLERIRFAEPPEIKLFIQGDALNTQAFDVQLTIQAANADTAWGNFTHNHLVLRLTPAGSNNLAHVFLTLESALADTPWATTTNLHLNLRGLSRDAQTNLAKAQIAVRADGAWTRWANGQELTLGADLAVADETPGLVQGNLSIAAARFASTWTAGTNLQFHGSWMHALTNPIPISGQGTVRCERAESTWCKGENLELRAWLSLLDPKPPPALGPATLWWTNLEPYRIGWQATAGSLSSSGVLATAVSSAGSWLAPDLVVTNLEVSLGAGRLDAQARLNVTTRALQASVTSDFDPQTAPGLMPAAARRWLSQFTWTAPPQAHGRLALVLPPWANPGPDPGAELLPTLVLDGRFNLASNATYRGVPFSSAQSHFTYSNRCWHLPDLVVRRPEGTLEAEHRANEITKDYFWRLRSSVDPNILRPVLGTNAAEGLSLLGLTEPPHVAVELRGRSQEPERIWARGQVDLTNFTFRGESFSRLQTQLEYTNQLLRVFEPRLDRGTQHLSADGLTADFRAQRVYLTNGFATAEPDVVARAIGAHIGRAIQPYRFLQPPTVQAHGVIPMRGEEDADLHFDITGGPFTWSKFHVPRIAGKLHWSGLKLSINDVTMDFYGGDASGYAEFSFTPKGPTQYHFALVTTNTQLRPLMMDYFGRTNQLEGLLSGDLVVTRGVDDQWRSANGYGHLTLRDGLIWDIPVFGVFSPVLNGITPGLGNSRAGAGSCTFSMTNGVLHTDDLEIRATTFRLRYRGTLDLEGNVRARAEAELLRDVWLVGPIVSTVFWPVTKMFEYRVSGTMGDPQTEPVYIVPRLVLFPFHPFKTLKGLFPYDAKAGRTNAPPEKTQE